MNLSQYVGGLAKKRDNETSIDVAGLSSEKGFNLKYRIRKEGYFFEGTSKIAGGADDYRIDLRLAFKIGNLATGIIGIALYLMGCHFILILALTWLNIVALPLFIEVSRQYWGIFKSRELRQWHACEHKTVEFITKNIYGQIDSDFETLKKCPSVNIHCGSIYNSTNALISLFFYIAVITTVVFIQGAELRIAGLAMISFWIIATLAQMIAYAKLKSNKLTEKNITILLPCFFIPLLLERWLCLANPSEDKMRLAHQEALKIIAWMKTQIDNKEPAI